MAANLDLCIEKLYRCDLLGEQTIKELTDKAKEILMFEPNVVALAPPVTIVGDIHGQFYDLMELFKVCGSCPDTNFLFLGDYADRGYFGVESICLLMCLKIRYPSRMTLLRGNHESRNISQVYGLYHECLRKYGNTNVWKYFCEMFDHLPLAAIVDDRIYCVHGGLSPSAASVDQIRILNRFKEVPSQGAMADLLWSDPDAEHAGFALSPRGCGYQFGQDVTFKFLSTNKLMHIVRTHQLCMDGFQAVFGEQLCTLWSAPNYCYRCGNVAAALEISDQRGVYFNTFLACPEGDRKKPVPDPAFEVPKAIPDYYL